MAERDKTENGKQLGKINYCIETGAPNGAKAVESVGSVRYFCTWRQKWIRFSAIKRRGRSGVGIGAAVHLSLSAPLDFLKQYYSLICSCLICVLLL